MSPPPVIGLSLAGASALGAYQAGVIRYVVDGLSQTIGQDVRFDVVSGTSAGALNGLGMASFADRPAEGARRLVAMWTGLRLGDVVRPSAVELLRWLTEPAGRLGRAVRAASAGSRRGGLLDPRPIERLIGQGWSPGRIAEHLRRGYLRGVAMSATHVATGRPVVFHQVASPPAWPREGSVPVATDLTPSHAMASAAIPVLFPAVSIDGDLYCDGGLRHMVPMSPALHLGATRLLVVSPVAHPSASGARIEDERRLASTSPLYLAGKALNALFADGLTGDLDRLETVNLLLRAGRQRFGAAFEDQIAHELSAMGARPMRTVEVCHIEPSQDLGAMAAAYVISREFARREHGPAAQVLRCLADGDPERVGDLLSYLLFDGGFAAQLVALGEADARARHDELCAMFARPRAAVLAG